MGNRVSVAHNLQKMGPTILFVALSILSVALTTSLRPVSAAPTGTYFDHIVIIAMENTPYQSVFGTGSSTNCPTSSAPFLCSMLPVSSTIPSMGNYGATSADSNDFNGCSAACYVGFMFGYTYGVSDGYSFSSVSGNPQFVNSLSSAGLSWQAYCENGCPRGADHFPFSGSNAFTSSVTTSTFVSAANSASPPSFLWYTPTDGHNMHDVSVSTGDSYLQSFLVGSGSISSPASGSLLASNVFTNPNYRTLLYLWWDECGGNNGSCDGNNDAPNLLYGTPVKKGYVSPDTTGIDEYASIWTIENNWGFAPLAQGDTAAKNSGYQFNDIFNSGTPLPLSASFTYLPSSPTAGSSVSFTATASGGTAPYSYSWSYGDGSTGSGVTATHAYSSSGSYTVTLTVADSAGGSSKPTQSVQVAPVSAPTASFTYNPSLPVSGQTVTFTASVSGGTSPYSYSWNLGGTSVTGNPVSQSFTNGTYTVSLTVTDSLGKTATSSQSVIVLSPSTGGSSVPVLIGWGGIRMDEAVANSGGTPSAVFPGESASNMELLVILLKAKGYNTVRVDFDPYCTDTVDYNYMSVYSQTNAQRAVAIAKSYGFWIIIDYHGYSDIFRNTSCWLNYWQPIVQNIGPLYSQIIWEPENEPEYYDCANSPSSCPSAPCSSDTSCVTYLSSAYQQWIDQARSLGDNHWIVVQNLCSYGCNLCPGGDGSCSAAVTGYPTVTDPLGTLSQGGRIFISVHSYMDYSYYSSSGGWNSATADSVAQGYYQTVVAGVQTTGWPALNTEGGTDPLCYPCSSSPPDTVMSGSAGYTTTTLHFIQALVNLYDSNSPQRINWVWWPAGSWTDTTSSVYGAMNCSSNPEGWGCLLTFLSLGPPAPDFTISASSPSTVNTGQSASSTITIGALNGFTGTVSLTNTVPSGLTCGAINPNTLSGSGTASITCSANSGGTYTVTVTGTSGSLSHSTTARFTVNQSDFTIGASTPSAVNAGQSTTTTITIAAVNGFSGAVALTDSVPSGLNCAGFSASIITGSGTATVSCSSANAGSYALTITATSGVLVHFTSTTFNFRDFAVSATSPSSVATGSSATSSITLSALNGFSGTIALSDTIPSGLTCSSLTPSSISGSGTATLACSSGTQGVYSVTITAGSGSLTHQATATFTFGTPADFTITANSPSPANVGSPEKSTISITLVHGFTGTVALTDSATSGLNCGSLSSTSLTTNGTSTVSCSSSSASTYTLTVTGTSGSIVHSTTITLSFEDFSLSANPSNLSLNTGAQGSSSISLNSLNGFASTVTLSVTNPSGLSVSLSRTSITGSTSSTLNISPSQAGSYTVVITGTSGSLTRTTSVTVTVGTQTLPVVSAPSAETVFQTESVSFTVSATESSAPASSLTLSASQMPSGASFPTVTGTASVSGTFRWTPTTATAPGTYTISFTVTDGVSTAQTYVVITVLSSNVLPVITGPRSQNATVGRSLHFAVSANDPTGTGGAVILSANGLASNMAFDPATGEFSFTPTASQAGQTFIVNFTATDSNNPAWTKTESVPINVQGSSAQNSNGGLCLSCLLPTGLTMTAWLLMMGALVGIVSSITIVHMRASADLAAAKRRMGSLNAENGRGRTYDRYQRPRAVSYARRRRFVTDDD